MLLEGKNRPVKFKFPWNDSILCIEFSPGDRRGKNKNLQKLNDYYGFIENSLTADGGDLDMYLQSDSEFDPELPIFIVHCLRRKEKIWDEDKVIFGCKNESEALSLWHRNVYNSEFRFGGISMFSLNQFEFLNHDLENGDVILADESVYYEMVDLGYFE